MLGPASRVNNNRVNSFAICHRKWQRHKLSLFYQFYTFIETHIFDWIEKQRLQKCSIFETRAASWTSKKSLHFKDKAELKEHFEYFEFDHK